MAWDKNLPDGDLPIDQGDDAIRDNNAAAETAIDLEHRFTTGGNQSGRHHFAADTTTNLDALADTVEGSIGFSTDERSGVYTLMIHDGTDFEPVDVNPGDLPRLDEPSQFTRMQWGQIQDISGDIASGTPDTLEIDLTKAPHQYATITNDTLITGLSASGNVSGYSTTFILEIIQGGGGGHAVTFDSPTDFIAAYGVAPFIETASGFRTMLQFTKSYDGLWAVTSTPGLAGF